MMMAIHDVYWLELECGCVKLTENSWKGSMCISSYCRFHKDLKHCVRHGRVSDDGKTVYFFYG